MIPLIFTLIIFLAAAIAYWWIEYDFRKAVQKAYKVADEGWDRALSHVEQLSKELQEMSRINHDLVKLNEELRLQNDIFVNNNNELLAKLLILKEVKK